MSLLSSQVRNHLILLVVMLVCLVLVFFGGHDLSHHAGKASGWTGLSHAALAAVMALGVSVHLVLKGGWIRSTLTLLGSRKNKARLWLFLVDAMACVLLLVTMVTGFVIWTQGRLGEASPAWTAAHHVTVKLFAAALTTHLVQHRRWIMVTLKKVWGVMSNGTAASAPKASPWK